MKGRGTLGWLGQILDRKFPSPAHKMTMLVLANYVDADDSCFPSQATLAELVQVSPRKMWAILQDLETLGCIARGRRHRGDGYRTSDLVTLLPEGVEALTLLAIPASRPTRKSVRSNSHKTGSNSHAGATLNHPVVNHPVVEQEQELTLVDVNVDASPVVDLAAEFESEWWPTWPDKRAKAAALSAYRKARRTATAVELLDAARRFAADPNRCAANTPHAATWLNQERWNDPPLLNRNGNRATNRLATTLASLATLNEGATNGRPSDAGVAARPQRELPGAAHAGPGGRVG